MKKGLCELSAEATGIAMVVAGLSNQLDGDKTESLTIESLKTALFGVSCYLERIADDLDEYKEAATCRN